MRFQAVYIIASTVVATTTVSVVDVVAFRPPISAGGISSTSLVYRNCYKKYHQSSTARCTSHSHLPLGSQNDHDGQEDVVVKNYHTTDAGLNNVVEKDDEVGTLLTLLDSVPSNLPTPRPLTEKILDSVRKLEECCPTSDKCVLPELAGNWELLWTAQDRSSEQYIKGGLVNRIINPLENQSYSNNPSILGDDESVGGRANPVLPREIQDVLERTGVLEASGGSKATPIRSSQAIDVRRKQVRNVVNVQIKKPFSLKGSVIVDVNFTANAHDERRIDVQFESCRFIFQNSNVDQKIPLGFFGPRGWLRTGYIDDRIRITRGHKGSVFILSRTARR